MAMADYLDIGTVETLYRAAVEAGLDALEIRVFLLAGINRQYVAGLPRLPASGDQLHSDLLAMRNVTLQGGEVPLASWLANAVARLGQRVEHDEFQAALEQVVGRRERDQPRDRPPGGTERIIHTYDLLPQGFLTAALTVSHSVARLTVPRFEAGRAQNFPGTDKPMRSFGTAWVLAPGLLMTNHHVVNNRSESEPGASEGDVAMQAQGIIVEFDYDADGMGSAKETVAELVAIDSDLDYAVLKMHGEVDRAPLRLADTKTIERLAESHGPVNIIQHPEGAPKSLGIRNNLIASHDADDLRYFTDTLGGSSGSPVCSDGWRVVALHKAWTYVAGDVEFQGKPTAWVNRGTRIDRIAERLQHASPQVWKEVVSS
jgi:endonuclease G